jgi:SAM-dependent methyltransferase
MTNPSTIHDSVRDYYADRARTSSPCCDSGDCCDSGAALYNVDLLTDLPSDVSGFSLGCGDPITLAHLQPGETVLDLGSGGGLDCFLAARQVGPQGRVIGVDMTPEMLERARSVAARLGATNVEFRQGYLEALPVEDNSVDVVISNCVINLSPDKPQVFREIFRVLRKADPASGISASASTGGRLSVSDIVTNGALPESVQNSMAAWGACVAGALDVRDYERSLREAGFGTVRIEPKQGADAALARLPVGVPFSASIVAQKGLIPHPQPALTPGPSSSGRGETSEALDCLAPGGLESRQPDIDRLMSRVAEVNTIADGYEFRLTGDVAESRALVEQFIRDEATCCSFLNFQLVEAEDELLLRLTGSREAMVLAKDIGIGKRDSPVVYSGRSGPD